MGHSVYQNRIETFDNYYLYTRNEGNLLHEYNGIQFIVSMQRHNIWDFFLMNSITEVIMPHRKGQYLYRL